MTKSLFLSVLLFALIPFRTSAQLQEICEPGYFEAVDDYFEVALDDFSVLYNVLDNDVIAVDYWELVGSDTPPCISLNRMEQLKSIQAHPQVMDQA